MRHLKRIKVYCEDLQPGMFVAALDRDWSESNFLLQGFTIEGQVDIDAVARQCEFVYVDFKSDEQFKLYKLKTTKSETYKKKIQESVDSSTFNLRAKLKPAFLNRKKTSNLLTSVMDKIMLGEDFEVQGVRTAVQENVKSVLHNQEAMLMLTMLKNQHEDVAQHSFNVSVLAIGFASYLGYSEEALEDIGMAALLHDIGQVKVDKILLNKAGKLNANEREAVEQHAKFGFDILAGKEGLTPSCLDVVYSHHERLNGSGYPRGLKENQITKNVRIVSIIEVFESLTSQQAYRKGLSILDSYKMLMAEKSSHYDESLILKFIKWRSIYPPGAIVEMQNGEVGIVVSANREHKLKPKVLLVLNEYKHPRKEKLVDLNKMALDPESKPYKISKVFENMAFGIDLQSYADKGLNIQF
ncbi:HD-GYP domain-containing protein [Aliikangiella sp. IMCC44653]